MPKTAKWVLDTMVSLMPSKMPFMKVVNTHYLTPFVKKIQFQGDLSGMNFQIGYAVVIRVSDTEARNYTASYWDHEKGIFEIIVHLHGKGPGSRLLDELLPGDKIRVSIPRGMRHYDASVKRHVIFGDETSLGLAYSFLPILQTNQHLFQFYFELDAENEQVPQLLGLENYTIFPKESRFRNEKLLRELSVFQETAWQDSNFVLTGNVQSIQTFRKALRHCNVGNKIVTKGYWLEGKVGL